VSVTPQSSGASVLGYAESRSVLERGLSWGKEEGTNGIESTVSLSVGCLKRDRTVLVESRLTKQFAGHSWFCGRRIRK
jgi:hypothetical protein